MTIWYMMSERHGANKRYYLTVQYNSSLFSEAVRNTHLRFRKLRHFNGRAAAELQWYYILKQINMQQFQALPYTEPMKVANRRGNLGDHSLFLWRKHGSSGLQGKQNPCYNASKKNCSFILSREAVCPRFWQFTWLLYATFEQHTPPCVIGSFSCILSTYDFHLWST